MLSTHVLNELVHDADAPPWGWGMLHFEPSLYYAAGHGLVSLDRSTEHIPQIMDFFSGKIATFDPNWIPNDAAFQPPDRNCLEHRYLFLCLGWLWKQFGISHQTAWILQYALLYAAVLALYALSRLVMGRILSIAVVCAFLYSPLLQSALGSSFRDFSRAPFFIAILLLLGMLLRQPRSARGHLVISGLLGLVIGLGMGFRADMMVSLPLSIPVVLFCRGNALQVRHRFTSLAALLLGVFLAGYGVYSKDYDALMMNGWRIACGFSGSCEDDMHLQQGSYEKLAIFHDDFGYFAAADSVALDAIPCAEPLRKLMPQGKEDSDKAAFQFIAYVAGIALAFPADMLLRVYGAAYTILQGVSPADNAPFFSRIAGFGPLAALFVILFASASSLRNALLLAYLLLAFCGYTCLLFHSRHISHFMFLNAWFVGAACSLYGNALRKKLLHSFKGHPSQPYLGLFAQRSAYLLITLAILLGGPLCLLRTIQAKRLAAIAAAHEAAPRQPAPFQERNVGDRILFQAESISDCSNPLSYQTFSFQAATYMVRLENVDHYPDLRIEYEPGMYLWKTHNIPFTFRNGNAPAAINVYFRAYEGMEKWTSLWFAGISLPKEQAPFFKGLYRIDDSALKTLPISIAVPDDRSCFQPWQRIRWRNDGATPRKFIRVQDVHELSDEDMTRTPAYPHHMRAFLERAKNAVHAGNLAEARIIWLRILDSFADHPAVFRHFLYHLEQDCGLTAWQECRTLAEMRPNMMCLQELSRICTEAHVRKIAQEIHAARQAGDSAQLTVLLNEANILAPNMPEILLLKAELLACNQQVEQGISMLPENVQAHFFSPEMLGDACRRIADCLYDNNYSNQRTTLLEQALNFHEQAIDQTPDNLWLAVTKGEILTKLGNVEKAIAVYLDILKKAPDSPYTANNLDALLQQESPEYRRKLWQNLAALYPDGAVLHFHLGRAAEDAEDWIAARNAYQHAAAADPSNPNALVHLGYVQIILGENHTGEQHLRRAQEIEPKLHTYSVELLGNLGDHFHAHNDIERAQRYYNMALEIDPEALWNKVRLGEIMADAGNAEQALNIFRDILLQKPDSPVSAEKADALLVKQGAEQRGAFWTTLVEQYPEAAIPNYYLGRAAEDREDWPAARFSYQQALAADPRNPYALFHLGYMEIILGEAASGEQRLLQATTIAPELQKYEAELLGKLGEYFRKNKNMQRAIHYSSQALEKDPSALWNKVRLGEIMADQGNTEQALNFFRDILFQTPESPITAEKADAILAAQGTEQRIQFWTRLVDQHPSASIPNVYLGKTLAQKQDWIAAKQAFQRAREADPDNPLLAIYLGCVLCMLDDTETGTTLINEALNKEASLNTHAAQLLSSFAKQCRNNQNHAHAIHLFKRAVELDASDLSNYVQLGELYLEQDDFPQALNAFQYVLTQAPESPHTATQVDLLFNHQKQCEQRIRFWKEIATLHPQADIPQKHLRRAVELCSDNNNPDVPNEQ